MSLTVFFLKLSILHFASLMATISSYGGQWLALLPKKVPVLSPGFGPFSCSSHVCVRSLLLTS